MVSWPAASRFKPLECCHLLKSQVRNLVLLREGGQRHVSEMKMDRGPESRHWATPLESQRARLASSALVSQLRRHKKEEDWKGWDSTWENWGGQGTPKRQSTPSPRAQNSQAPQQSPRAKAKGTKGKGKKGKFRGDGSVSGKGTLPSLPPWPTWDVTQAGVSPFTNQYSSAPVEDASGASSTLQEMAVQLRIAYQDPDSRPQDVQALLDKADKEAGRTNIKSIHAATRSLDKAQETLQKSITDKKNHRLMWTKHVGEGIKIWEAQLESYRVHQAHLAEQAARARAEIAQARGIIQELSDKAVKSGNNVIPQPIKEETEDSVVDVFDDPEEQKLRSALQGVLTACAGSLGIASEGSAEKIVQEISDDEKEHPPHFKRPRSVEPAAKSNEMKS
eukprot:s697_g3.t1